MKKVILMKKFIFIMLLLSAVSAELKAYTVTPMQIEAPKAFIQATDPLVALASILKLSITNKFHWI
jgi:hypothetical protein